MESIEAHSMRLLSTVPSGEMKSSAVRFEPGDVLYGRLRPYLNKVFMPTFEGLCSAEFIVFPPVPNVVPKYLQYLLNSGNFLRFASRLNTGDRPRVDFEQLASFLIPLPPLAEQHRIVAAIEEHLSWLDAAVEGLERVRAQLPRYRAAVLKAAVEIAQTASGDGEQPGPKRIADLATLVQYGTSARTSEDGEVPVLRMGNIVSGSLNTNELKYLAADHDEFPELLLEPGDLLFNRTNSAELVGKCAVYAGLPKPCSFASYLIRVRFGEGCDPRFAAAYINSPYGRGWIRSVVNQQVGQANVNGSKLKALSIPVPPVAKQKAIMAEVDSRLSQADATSREIDRSVMYADRLRQSILRRAFSGQLVPQDPNDEPASVLLDRIRAERAAAPARRVSGRRRKAAR